MRRTFTFYKNAKEEWFADLPEWHGDPDDLQMVEGADQLLNMIAGHARSCTLEMADEPFDGAEVLTLVHVRDPELSGGGDYVLKKFKGEHLNHKVWLCAVTIFVFNSLPREIWFKSAVFSP